MFLCASAHSAVCFIFFFASGRKRGGKTKKSKALSLEYKDLEFPRGCPNRNEEERVGLMQVTIREANKQDLPELAKC
jgi:hypothetical protein